MKQASASTAPVEQLAPAARVPQRRTIERDIPDVCVDRRALKQILLNLVTNAIKFSPAEACSEVFATLSPSGELTLGVRDEGIGIADDDQARAAADTVVSGAQRG